MLGEVGSPGHRRRGEEVPAPRDWAAFRRQDHQDAGGGSHRKCKARIRAPTQNPAPQRDSRPRAAHRLSPRRHLPRDGAVREPGDVRPARRDRPLRRGRRPHPLPPATRRHPFPAPPRGRPPRPQAQQHSGERAWPNQTTCCSRSRTSTWPSSSTSTRTTTSWTRTTTR